MRYVRLLHRVIGPTYVLELHRLSYPDVDTWKELANELDEDANVAAIGPKLMSTDCTPNRGRYTTTEATNHNLTNQYRYKHVDDDIVETSKWLCIP